MVNKEAVEGTEVIILGNYSQPAEKRMHNNQRSGKDVNIRPVTVSLHTLKLGQQWLPKESLRERSHIGEGRTFYFEISVLIGIMGI